MQNKKDSPNVLLITMDQWPGSFWVVKVIQLLKHQLLTVLLGMAHDLQELILNVQSAYRLEKYYDWTNP